MPTNTVLGPKFWLNVWFFKKTKKTPDDSVYSALLDKFWWISLYVTEDVIAKLYMT